MNRTKSSHGKEIFLKDGRDENKNIGILVEAVIYEREKYRRKSGK